MLTLHYYLLYLFFNLSILFMTDSSFFTSYCEALLFTSTDSDGEDLSREFTIDDLLKCSEIDALRKDCLDFQHQNRALLTLAYTDEIYTSSQAGHDFLLTQNGHGAGFFDRGHHEVGERLTEAAHAFGTVELYTAHAGAGIELNIQQCKPRHYKFSSSI